MEDEVLMLGGVSIPYAKIDAVEYNCALDNLPVPVIDRSTTYAKAALSAFFVVLGFVLLPVSALPGGCLVLIAGIALLRQAGKLSQIAKAKRDLDAAIADARNRAVLDGADPKVRA